MQLQCQWNTTHFWFLRCDSEACKNVIDEPWITLYIKMQIGNQVKCCSILPKCKIIKYNHQPFH